MKRKRCLLFSCLKECFFFFFLIFKMQMMFKEPVPENPKPEDNEDEEMKKDRKNYVIRVDDVHDEDLICLLYDPTIQPNKFFTFGTTNFLSRFLSTQTDSSVAISHHRSLFIMKVIISFFKRERDLKPIRLLLETYHPSNQFRFNKFSGGGFPKNQRRDPPELQASSQFLHQRHFL